MVLGAIDDDHQSAANSMRWMPSHTSAARMKSAPPLDSRGEPITWVMWRANRLADALAKSAADQRRLPAAALAFLRDAKDLHLHQAAVLGMVTYAANHHREAGSDDASGWRRDSAGQRPRKPRTWHRFAPNHASQICRAAAVAAAPQTTGDSGPRVPEGAGAKRRRLAQEHRLREEVEDAHRVSSFLARTDLHPASSQVAAPARLQAVLDRVRQREAEERAWLTEQMRASWI